MHTHSDIVVAITFRRTDTRPVFRSTSDETSVSKDAALRWHSLLYPRFTEVRRSVEKHSEMVRERLLSGRTGDLRV